jgi:hypothetical protein
MRKSMYFVAVVAALLLFWRRFAFYIEDPALRFAAIVAVGALFTAILSVAESRNKGPIGKN